jgi:hypothetical protein
MYTGMENIKHTSINADRNQIPLIGDTQNEKRRGLRHGGGLHGPNPTYAVANTQTNNRNEALHEVTAPKDKLLKMICMIIIRLI